MQQLVKGNGSAISDTCGDRDLADQVKPAGIPAPGRSTTPSKAELGRPVIETAGRRVRGGQFSHAQRDDNHEDSDERPANRVGSKAHRGGDKGKECYAPTQDPEHAKVNRKVGETTHSSKHFLGL